MEFAERMENLIDNGMFDEFVRELLDPVNVDRVKANGMELVTQICSKGINEVEETDPSLTIWLDALDYVLKYAKPKEAYAGLMEQSVSFAHTNKFIYLLQPIQVAFVKLPTVRASHMEGILKHILHHIKTYLSVPDYIKAAEWEGKETLAIEEDPQMRRIAQCYKYCLILITAFVDNYVALESSPIAREPKVVEDLGRRLSLLRNVLVNLLGKPLVYFDLHLAEDPDADPQHRSVNVKTEGRVTAEKIMKLLAVLQVNIPYFFIWLDQSKSKSLRDSIRKNGSGLSDVAASSTEMVDLTSDDEDDNLTYEPQLDMVSVLTYFYMLKCENVGGDHICLVFTPAYVFNTILVSIVNCLENNEDNMIIKKATVLTRALLDLPSPVHLHGLNANMIQTDVHKSFIEKIVTVIIYCKMSGVRRKALEALTKYLWAFDGYGRFMLLVRGFEVIQHSGLLGYLVTQLKEFIREVLYDAHATDEMKKYFLGERLTSLLLKVCILKDGATTDLTENSDLIISVLNLVRYLLLTDGAANRSCFYSSMKTIESGLLKPLRIALDYSKAHFEQELRQLKENPNSKDPSKSTTVESNVMVDGKELPASEMPVKDKIASVQSALSAFDMMFSLLARVNECYDQAKTSQSKG